MEMMMQRQKVFRVLLDALSHPGTLFSFQAEKQYPKELYNQTMAITHCVLDGEITYCALAVSDMTKQEIEIYTLSNEGPLAVADFVIASANVSGEVLNEAIQKMKKGDLMNPHDSATLILEVKKLDHSGMVRMSGPGIRSEQMLGIVGHHDWIDYRNEAVSEFPLGVDVFLIDEHGSVVGIPRTTRLERV